MSDDYCLLGVSAIGGPFRVSLTPSRISLLFNENATETEDGKRECKPSEVGNEPPWYRSYVRAKSAL